jgi:hypothetical protein
MGDGDIAGINIGVLASNTTIKTEPELSRLEIL